MVISLRVLPVPLPPNQVPESLSCPVHANPGFQPLLSGLITISVATVDQIFTYKPNINYASSLEELTYKSVEQDKVSLKEFGLWFVGNTLPADNKKKPVLEASTKFTYFTHETSITLPIPRPPSRKIFR